MFKRLLSLFTAVLVCFIFTACGSGVEKIETPSAPTKETEPSPLKEEAETDDSKYETIPAGKYAILKEKNNLGIISTSGPMEVEISDIRIGEIIPSEEFAEYVGTSDPVTVVSLHLYVENTSTETFSIYPDQSTLVAGKVQVDSDLWESDSIGGDYLGGVLKDGTVQFFLTTTPASEITEVRFYLDGAFNMDTYDSGNDIDVTIPVS